MLFNLKNTPYGVTRFKTRFILIKKIHSTPFWKNFKNLFKKKKVKYDPFAEKYYEDSEERFDNDTPEELMIIYYQDYWDAWESSRKEHGYFINFNDKAMFYDPIEAEGLPYHYPFEMYAPGDEDEENFDSIKTDPFSKEELLLPLTTLRWNYYRETFYDEIKKDLDRTLFNYVLMDGWHFAKDLENMDLIDAILATIHDPKYRNTALYEEFYEIAKTRYDILFTIYIDYNGFGNTTLMIIPWIASFLVYDLLENVLNHPEIMFYDLQSVFLYLFCGNKLTWKYHTLKKSKYKNQYRLYQTCYSTLEKDCIKIWRLINLKSTEPKLYNKFKQYYILMLQRKLNLTVIGLRARAVRAKQTFKIDLFNSASLIRFFIWCYKRLLESLSLFFDNIKSFLVNLPNTIFNFLIKLPEKTFNFFKKLYNHNIKSIKKIYKYFTTNSFSEMYNHIKQLYKELDKQFQRFKVFYFEKR